VKKGFLQNISVAIVGFGVSAVLLSVIHPPWGISYLAWIAMVPYLLLCCGKFKYRYIFVGGYMVSTVYWLANLYWVMYVTVPGWIAFCLYTALLWPLAGICLRWCCQKKIPLVLAAAVITVGAENMQGLFFGGFYWRFLAHSQYANTELIQIADIFGTAGVSLLVVMVNALAAEMIIAYFKHQKFSPVLAIKAATVIMCIIAAVFYGRYRISQSEQAVTMGPMVASVQTNIPQIVKDSEDDPDAITKELFDLSQQCISADAEVVIWPETIAPGILDDRILRVLPASHRYNILDKQIRQLCQNRTFLLAGASGGTAQINDYSVDLIERYNSAFLYRPDGSKAPCQYNKIHLVPFGEIIPFRQSMPWLHKILMAFNPYDYDYSLDYGKQYTIFEISNPDNQNDIPYRFAVMICYESTVAEIPANFVLDENAKKRIDWLVNISNDGWFVKFYDGSVKPSTELAQHAAANVFRAVENRVSVIRSVNTGISCLIDSTGRFMNDYQAGNLPENVMDRGGISGWFADKMPIDNRVTFFSKHPKWLAKLCVYCVAALIVWLILERILKVIVILLRRINSYTNRQLSENNDNKHRQESQKC